MAVSLTRPCGEEAPHADYTHLAFSVSEAGHPDLAARVAAECRIWKDDVSEEASTYSLDPDGHKPELQAGTLESRLAVYRADAGKDVTVLD